jgi:hypothetical protein
MFHSIGFKNYLLPMFSFTEIAVVTRNPHCEKACMRTGETMRIFA